MSENTVKLLQAAAEMLGGEQALADRLAIDSEMLAKYMADTRPLPDLLLLKLVDMVLAEREALVSAAQRRAMGERGIVT